ncbi:MAG: DUF4872 domain-containing protein [Lachnospiraceae bacterium]|nr:DUF4872 domain-containing protein [Lachnospiraceae bacterium]
MIKKIESFKPFTGTLCIATSLGNIVRSMAGADYGEEMYYGLGSALYFGYIVSDDMRALGASTDLLLDNLKDNLTLSKLEIKYEDESVFEQVKGFVDEGVPVLVKGMHFHEETDLKEDRILMDRLDLPMNQHYTTIYGYDDKEKAFLMADNIHNGMVPLERFLRVRDSERTLLMFLVPKSFEHMDYRVYGAIRKTMDYWYRMPNNPKPVADFYTTQCLHLNTVYATLDGLDKFKSEFLRGIEIENFANYSKTVFFLRIISYRGTGGDMTRGLQGRFLKEAYKLTNDSRMLDVSKLYGTAAREWRSFLKLFDKDENESFKEVTDPILVKPYHEKIVKLYDCEMKALEALTKIAYE